MKSEIEKFTALNQTLSDLRDKKIRLEEQFKSKKASLSELLKEIKAAGYDPTKLKEIIQEKETSLKKQIADFEQEVTKVSSALSKIEV
jgi:uncharacterized protein (UPF0335 family)